MACQSPTSTRLGCSPLTRSARGVRHILPPPRRILPAVASASSPGPETLTSAPAPGAPAPSLSSAPAPPPPPPSPLPAHSAPASISPCQTQPDPNAYLIARHKQRVAAEIVEAALRAGLPASPDQLLAGLAALESLLPGALAPNLEKLKPADWARLALDVPSAACKLVLLKSHFPSLDLPRVLAAQPGLLLRPAEQLGREAQQVRSLLSRARDSCRLLSAEPALLCPRRLISVLVTVGKWYQLKRDPLEVLEADPDIVQRAQDNDVPFEPVYADQYGNWVAPQLAYAERRTDWQRYLDERAGKQPWTI